MDLKSKGGGGGGVSFGKNVDLCTIPYGAFGPRGRGGLRTPRPPPGYGPGNPTRYSCIDPTLHRRRQGGGA